MFKTTNILSLVIVFLLSMTPCYSQVRKSLKLESVSDIEKVLSQESTRIIITGDYDLKGKVINVGKNSILQFDGGSLRNGTLKNQFSIEAPTYQIFYNIKLVDKIGSGIKFEWFGGVGNNDSFTNNSIIFNSIMSSSQNIVFQSGVVYTFFNTLEMFAHSAIVGNDATLQYFGKDTSFIKLGLKCKVENCNIRQRKPIDCTLLDISSNYIAYRHNEGFSQNRWDSGFNDIYGIRVNNVTIENTTDHYNTGNAILISATDKNVDKQHLGLYGFEITINYVNILGRFMQAVKVVNVKTQIDAKDTPWMNEIVLNRVNIWHSVEGFWIGTSISEDVRRAGERYVKAIYPPERVIIQNCSMQCRSFDKKSTHMVEIENGHRIIIDNCEAWDFSQTVSTRPFCVNRGEKESWSYVVATNNSDNLYYKDSASGEYRLDNLIQNNNNTGGGFGAYMGEFTHSCPIPKGNYKIIDLLTLPAGIYNVFQDAVIGQKLGLLPNGTTNIGGVMVVMHSGNLGPLSHVIAFIPNMIKSNEQVYASNKPYVYILSSDRTSINQVGVKNAIGTLTPLRELCMEDWIILSDYRALESQISDLTSRINKLEERIKQ